MLVKCNNFCKELQIPPVRSPNVANEKLVGKAGELLKLRKNFKKKEITEISPFFQLPNYESKQELIFFPTSIYLDDKKYVNISYNNQKKSKIEWEFIPRETIDLGNIN